MSFANFSNRLELGAHFKTLMTLQFTKVVVLGFVRNAFSQVLLNFTYIFTRHNELSIQILDYCQHANFLMLFIYGCISSLHSKELIVSETTIN